MSSDIRIHDAASNPEDPEYVEKCIAELENQYDAYCEAQLYQHLGGASRIDIYAIPAEAYGPDPFECRKRDQL